MQRKSRLLTRAAVGIGALGLLGGLAGPAFATITPGAGPQGNGTTTAGITVGETLTFTFNNGGTSFNVPPGGTAPNAVNFTVMTNDPGGYTLYEYANDLTAPGTTATIPSGDLSEQLTYTDTGHTNAYRGAAGFAEALTHDGGAGFYISPVGPSLPTGDVFSETWLSAPLTDQAPGMYTTALTYLASGN